MAAKTDVHTDLDIGTVIEILELLVASKKVTVNEKLHRPAGGEVYVCEKSDKGMQLGIYTLRNCVMSKILCGITVA